MASGLGGPGRRDPPLHVFLMAIALVLAAFAGAAIGLVWQSSGFGDEGTEAESGEEPANGSASAGDEVEAEDAA